MSKLEISQGWPLADFDVMMSCDSNFSVIAEEYLGDAPHFIEPHFDQEEKVAGIVCRLAGNEESPAPLIIARTNGSNNPDLWMQDRSSTYSLARAVATAKDGMTYPDNDTWIEAQAGFMFSRFIAGMKDVMSATRYDNLMPKVPVMDEAHSIVDKKEQLRSISDALLALPLESRVTYGEGGFKREIEKDRYEGGEILRVKTATISELRVYTIREGSAPLIARVIGSKQRVEEEATLSDLYDCIAVLNARPGLRS